MAIAIDVKGAFTLYHGRSILYSVLHYLNVVVLGHGILATCLVLFDIVLYSCFCPELSYAKQRVEQVVVGIAYAFV